MRTRLDAGILSHASQALFLDAFASGLTRVIAAVSTKKARVAALGCLVVVGPPAVGAYPTGCTLDRPLPVPNGEALLPGFRFDDFDHDGFDRTDALASVGATRKAVGQQREEPARGSRKDDTAVVVV